MRKTAIYRDDLFLEHQPGFNHVESPDRIRVIFDALDENQYGGNFLYPSFDPASLEAIGRNHDAAHIKHVAATAGKSHGFLDADTQTSEKSYDAACLAAGALINGINKLDSGEIDNAFCLVRPPGHHAERDHSMGFCLFNNVAIAAYYALAELGYERVMIFDWDLHHGNGTQHSFYDSDKVLYCSTHQYPYYPGTGAVPEVGKGAGQGYTVNVPLSGGQGDLEFASIVNKLIIPLVHAYKPDLLLVSAGFDTYDGDPLGAMRVSPAGFAYMSRVLRQAADEVCNGKLLVTLEGGYNLNGMLHGALAVLSELAGAEAGVEYEDELTEAKAKELAEASPTIAALDQALTVAKNFWNL